MILFLMACRIVPQTQVELLLDPDRDGWPIDIDCDNADPQLGGSELLTDAIDNDCDGHAIIDLRNWPLDDSTCWTEVVGTLSNPALVQDGGFTTLNDGAERSADRVRTAPDVEGDGITELLYADDGAVGFLPSEGSPVQFEVPGDPGRSLAWGGMVEGCPTVLVAGPHPIQPAWIEVNRVELCTGTVRSSWTWSAAERSLEDVHFLPLTLDFWPDAVLTDPEDDAPSLSIQYRTAPDSPAEHDFFDAQIRGDGALFGLFVAAADGSGDNLPDLLVSAAEGAWLIDGTQLPRGGEGFESVRVQDVGVFLAAGPPAAVAFSDLDGDGLREALVAVQTDTGLRVEAYNATGENTATLYAPPGSCDAVSMSPTALVSGGAAFWLP